MRTTVLSTKKYLGAIGVGYLLHGLGASDMDGELMATRLDLVIWNAQWLVLTVCQFIAKVCCKPKFKSCWQNGLFVEFIADLIHCVYGKMPTWIQTFRTTLCRLARSIDLKFLRSGIDSFNSHMEIAEGL